MAKITLPSISSGFNVQSQINQTLALIETEFQNKVLYRSNTPGEPNQMDNDLDMNQKSILNIGSINGVDLVDLSNLSAYTAQSAVSAAAALVSENNALASADSALVSAISASSSAQQAAAYSSTGFSTANGFDFGWVSDPVILFPTDWGTI